MVRIALKFDLLKLPFQPQHFVIALLYFVSFLMQIINICFHIQIHSKHIGCPSEFEFDGTINGIIRFFDQMIECKINANGCFDARQAINGLFAKVIPFRNFCITSQIYLRGVLKEECCASFCFVCSV